MQVGNQRWLTVGAIIFLGGAGLLAADAVRKAHTAALSQPCCPRLLTSARLLPCCHQQTAELVVGRFQQDDDDDD